ncbi:MAG: SIS domain-containing protein [Vicinamibacterales bacterium]
MFSVERHLSEYVRVLSHIDPTAVEQLSQLLLNAWRNNRTIFCCGNGGSAANASHVAADLTKLTAPAKGRRLRAVALTESAASISAIANDVSYDDIFVEQLRTFAVPNDVLVAFSTSGRSPNVLRAVEYANSIAAVTVAVTGQDGVVLRGLAQHTVSLRSTSVQQIEDATMTLGHLLCLRTKELVARESMDVSFRPRAAAARDLRAPDQSAM